MIKRSCTRCGTQHEDNEPCRCPKCGSESIDETGGGFSGDIRSHGGVMVGVDLSEIKCKDCGLTWMW
jgi:transcription elongation factor Elf1